MKWATSWALSLVVLTSGGFSRAEDAIVTDRPDFVESGDTVGRGHLQLETGYARESTRLDGDAQETTTVPTLIRVGISKTLELRYETDGYTDVLLAGTHTRGVSDGALGIKWHSADAQGFLPSMAWLLHADIASGSREFIGKGTRPSLRIVGEWELPYECSLGVMPGLMWDYDDHAQGYLKGILAATMGHSWTSRFRSFVEVSGQELREKRHGGNVLTADAGLAWLLTDRIQLDAAGSRGLTTDAADWAWTLGLSSKL